MDFAFLSIRNVDGKLLLFCDDIKLPRQTYCEIRQTTFEAFAGIATVYVEFLHDPQEPPPFPNDARVEVVLDKLTINGQAVDGVVRKDKNEPGKYSITVEIILKNDKSPCTRTPNEFQHRMVASMASAESGTADVRPPVRV